MIDIIYQIIKTIINKELRGNVTPDEFNKIAKQVQEEIFYEYFADINLQKNKNNRGLVNTNHGNIVSQIRQKIDMFYESATLSYNVPTQTFTLPEDLYFIEQNGIMYNGNVVDETVTSDSGYLFNTMAAPSTVFPVYKNVRNGVKIYPETIQSGVTLSYLRIPNTPKWTYTSVNNIELFDNSLPDYQDFELHESELSNIVVRMLSYFGINIKETDITQYAEGLKQVSENKEQK